VAASTAAIPAYAHHDWGSSDFEHAYYLTGQVQEVVKWGNPHVEVAVSVGETPEPTDEVRSWPLPQNLVELGGQETLDRAEALPERLQGETVVVELPSLPTLAERGFGDQPEPGERIEAVGYLNKTQDSLFRSEVVVREDGEPVQTRAYATGWTGGSDPGAPGGGSGALPSEAASPSGPPAWRGTATLAAAGALVLLVLRATGRRTRPGRPKGSVGDPERGA